MARGISLLIVLVGSLGLSGFGQESASCQEPSTQDESLQMNERPDDEIKRFSAGDLLVKLPKEARPDPEGNWLQSECAVANDWLGDFDFSDWYITLHLPVQPTVEPDPDHKHRYRLTATASLTSLDNYEEGSVLSYSGDADSPFDGIPVSVELTDLSAAEARRLELQLTRDGLLVWSKVVSARFSFYENILSTTGGDPSTENAFGNQLDGIMSLGVLAMVIPPNSLAELRYPLLVIWLENAYAWPDENIMK